MSLPVPDLDDRHFQDLVDEAKRMIPSLVPEWTNHNVSDPGVALIELFAWMSEQVIFRLNQVPEKLYVEFLNLLGMTPFPASAAQVPLTFRLAGIPDEPVLVPAGTEVTTATDGGIVFATRDDLRIIQPRIDAAVTSRGDTSFTDVIAALRYDRDTVTCFSSAPAAPGDAFNLGFSGSMATQLVELRIETAERGVGVDPANPPIVWEAWSGEHWIPAQLLRDTTGGLNRSGTVRLVVPDAHEALVLGGVRAFWIRVRLLATAPGQPTFSTSPKLVSIAAVTLGGSVIAEHARTVNNEVVGTSDGTPGQQFTLGHRPVLARSDDEQVVIITDGQRHHYDEVVDFGASGPADRHVRIDGASGMIEFGPRIRYPDGTAVQHGMVPPFGAQVTMSSYRHGGGTRGNVGSETLTSMRTAIPYVDTVSNLVPARGGVDAETVDEVKVRGPRTLRTGQRAVTGSDYEQLTLESSPQVARAACIVPASPQDPVRVLVVPTSDRDPQTYTLDDFSLSSELFATVRDHLEARRTLGALVRVSAPYYQGVSVIVRLRAAAGRAPAAVRERVADAIAGFLGPLRGGPHGTGWPFDTNLTAAALTTMLEDVPGVSAVDELALFEYDLRNRQRLGDARDTIPLDPGSLFLAGGNQVVVR